MKNLIYLLSSIGLLFSCTSTKNTLSVKNDSDTNYRIDKINKNNSWYIIYAERNDSLFKIVSYAENNIGQNCRKIVVGGKYDFELRSKKENAQK